MKCRLTDTTHVRNVSEMPVGNAPMPDAVAPDIFNDADVLSMERAAAAAWPASRLVGIDGWQVRLSGGGSRRANSVLPLAYAGSDLDRAIDAVEALYRAEGSRSYFQVSSIARPQDIDARLAARGYAYEEPCLLMAKRLTPQPLPAGVQCSDEPSPAWLSVYTEPLEPVRRAAAPGVLAVVPKPRQFFLISRDGEPLTSALAVRSGPGVALVECVATVVAGRRMGGAQVIMDAVESWSQANGATFCALQVVEGNTAARSLYARRGYVETGRYHYRWKQID